MFFADPDNLKYRFDILRRRKSIYRSAMIPNMDLFPDLVPKIAEILRRRVDVKTIMSMLGQFFGERHRDRMPTLSIKDLIGFIDGDHFAILGTDAIDHLSEVRPSLDVFIIVREI